jgi:transcriptional regulator with XRE-family HTH domain
MTPGPGAWELPEMRGAVASRNYGQVFAILRRLGYTQDQLSSMTGYSHTEVAAIISGRPVISYDVQFRLAKRLGLPLCLAGFADCPLVCANRGPAARGDAA